jgi:endonuclease YncB( thermonuclease family)
MRAGQAAPVVTVQPRREVLRRGLLAALLAVTVHASAGEIVGKVVAVQDGDTLTVLIGRKQVRVRLVDIDAPERKQPFGNRLRQSLAKLCARKDATVNETEKDRYGRTLGRVYCGGVDANAEQVRRGMAWMYIKYAPKDSPLYAVQAEARAARRGPWQDARPVPPWEWRLRTERR